jgi:TatD DNase family protein
MAEDLMELGFYVSFSGNVTFKSAGLVREAARAVPLERMLVETDAPYLTPNPLRGKRNEPAFVTHTAEYLAKLKGVDIATFGSVTTANFYRVFGMSQNH